MTNIVEHLEKFSGQIAEGWSKDADGNSMPFQVVRTESGPIEGSVTFATLGLSNHPLKSTLSNKIIRQELIMLFRADAVPSNIVGIIQQAGLEAITRGHAYLRGEVIGPRGALFPSFEPKALYVTIPVYFPDEFTSVSTEKIGDVIFAWLVPMLDDEVRFEAEHGWEKFEDRLAIVDPDLYDYTRAT
ncbi:suppressor of fused domain protein [Dyella silvatica]|uniref:suppressor of fused domain protein n=1 Tax=Dyella silvatica TaxID=2992128 RepID=UPI00225BBAFB|nr:suppressor of fused domain protein [Dyella silvatica]